MSEVRRTADSRQSESEAKPARNKASPERGGAWGGWRRNVRKRKSEQPRRPVPAGVADRSQSPHSSDEAGNRPWSQGGQEGGSVKEIQLQIKLPGVPLAKQGREVPPRWEWTEASVWTERMLATLERGIKGGKWFSLMTKSGRRTTCKGRPKRWRLAKAPRKRTDASAGAIWKKAPGDYRDCRSRSQEANTSPNPCNESGFPSWAAKN